ncbi:MAG: DUF6784 domain-containing protein [Armatimonadota bacterium]|nr:DUF6784 domain-containing protein [Armatimonadota bacterium]
MLRSLRGPGVTRPAISSAPAGGFERMAGWGSGLAIQEYTALTSYASAHAMPDPQRVGATVVGFLTVMLLSIVRMHLLRFPLHPLGFAMGTITTGVALWGPFFTVWAVKSLILRIWGRSVYRTLVPAFLGLAIGHYFTAGVVWSLLGSIGESFFGRYFVWFG